MLKNGVQEVGINSCEEVISLLLFFCSPRTMSACLAIIAIGAFVKKTYPEEF